MPLYAEDCVGVATEKNIYGNVTATGRVFIG